MEAYALQYLTSPKKYHSSILQVTDVLVRFVATDENLIGSWAARPKINFRVPSKSDREMLC